MTTKTLPDLRVLLRLKVVQARAARRCDDQLAVELAHQEIDRLLERLIRSGSPH